MQAKQKTSSVIFISLALSIAMLFSVVLFSPSHTFAQAQSEENTQQEPTLEQLGESVKEPEVPDGNSTDVVPLDQNPIIVWLVYIVNVLLIGVGLVVVGAIIYSGIQYMISQGNSQKTAEARNRIISSLVAVALYALMFSLLQWLIPGGVFN